MRSWTPKTSLTVKNEVKGSKRKKMTKINWQDIPDHPTWLNPNPTRDELETLIARIPKTITIPAKQEPWQRDKTEALRRKIVALTKALELKLAALNPPRTIVSTMTREQLFLLKNPHWTDGLSAKQVENTFFLIRSATVQEKDVNISDIFSRILRC